MRDQAILQRRLAEARRWKKTAIELRGLLLNSIPLQILREPFQFKIVSVDLSYNKLFDLFGVGCLRNLQTLCARNNLLEEIPIELSNLQALTVLDLAHNNISGIPGCAARLHELKVINLSGNEIRYLPEDLIFTCKLERLHVTKNPIKNVPRDVFTQGLLALWLRLDVM